MATSYWLLVVGNWLLVVSSSSQLATTYWLLAASYWLLAVSSSSQLVAFSKPISKLQDVNFCTASSRHRLGKVELAAPGKQHCSSHRISSDFKIFVASRAEMKFGGIPCCIDYKSMQRCIVLYCIVLCRIVLYRMVRYGTVWYCIALYCIDYQWPSPPETS